MICKQKKLQALLCNSCFKAKYLKDSSELLKRTIVLPKCNVVPSVTHSFSDEDAYLSCINI